MNILSKLDSSEGEIADVMVSLSRDEAALINDLLDRMREGFKL